MTFPAHKPRVKKGNQTKKTPDTIKPKPAPETVAGQPDLTALTPDSVLYLQRTIGNQAVQRLIAEQSQPQPDGGVDLRQRKKTSFIQQQLSPPEHIQQPETKPVSVEKSPRDNAPPVQLLAMSDNPIDASNLTDFRQLTGGAVGKVFLLEAGAEKLVIKLEPRSGSSTVLGSEITRQAGGPTPEIRTATAADRHRICQGLLLLRAGDPQYADLHRSFVEALQGEFPHMVVMAFQPGEASGRKIAFNFEITTRFMGAMLSELFQSDLGRILAADAFSGNADRLHVYHEGGSILEIWFNPGNLLIAPAEGDEFHAFAIDNEFRPEKLRVEHTGYGMSRNMPNLTAASEEAFTQEVTAIYEGLLKQTTVEVSDARRAAAEAADAVFASGRARPKEKRIKPSRQERRLRRRLQRNKDTFVANVVASAQAAMGRLLARGQGWKRQIIAAGGTPDDVANFRVRNRLFRLLRAGYSVREARSIAANQTRYRRWVLIEQLHFPPERAEELLAMDEEAYDKNETYKASVRDTIRTGQPTVTIVRS